MQVVFCTDGIFPHAVGGMQRHSLLLIHELAKYSDIELIVVHPHQETIFPSLKNVLEKKIEGINVNKNYLNECYAYSKRVSSVIDLFPSALVYAQGLTVWHNIHKYQNRLIVNPHGLEPYQAIGLKDRLIALPFKRVFNKLFKNAAYTVSLGGKLTEILNKRAKRVVVIPNATNVADVKLEKDFSIETNTVLFVGRFASNKGIDVLMKAIAGINASGNASRFTFHLSGKGPMYEHYISKNNQNNVIFHGFTSDEKLNELYTKAHLFVLPTLFEGMPTVVLEAMAHQTPIIVTDVGATKELVDQTNGFIIETNSVESLQKALLNFASMPIDRKVEMGHNGYNKVKDCFTWEIVAQKHYHLFKALSGSI